jgi:hypothetical protein
LLTQEEVRTLSRANREAGWLEIPPSCPANFVDKICQYRKAVLSEKLTRNTAKDTAKRKALAEKLLQECAAEETAANLKRLRLRYQNLFD